MNPGENFDTPMVKHMVVLVVLVRIQICQGSSKLYQFVVIAFMQPLFAIVHNLEMEKRPKC